MEKRKKMERNRKCELMEPGTLENPRVSRKAPYNSNPSLLLYLLAAKDATGDIELHCSTTCLTSATEGFGEKLQLDQIYIYEIKDKSTGERGESHSIL